MLPDEGRKVLTDLHNTLPRSSKSADDLLVASSVLKCKSQGCSNEVKPDELYCSISCSLPIEKVGYKPLVNQEGSTASETDNAKVETTSQRKNRPKLFRQKSFEIDSDSQTEGDANQQQTTASAENKLPPLKEQTTTDVKIEGPKEEKNQQKKKRPALTIKIQNSSFNYDNDKDEVDLVSELEKSPNIYISGVNICRSPGSSTSTSILGPGSSFTLSPNLLKSLNNANRQHRSSSLIVPPVIRRRSGCSSTGSPGSKSLHLSPLNQHPRKSQTLFTFPDPAVAAPNAEQSAADGLLSSILHVHERYLSSEDFHEALFFERSPKSGQRKRSRSKSSKNNTVATVLKNGQDTIKKKLSVTQL